MKILDCTLRDGGYCNNWEFGQENIVKIVNSLVEAGIDIIECGFLTNKVQHNPHVSKFNTLEEIECVLPVNRGRVKFVCMVNYGEYHTSAIPHRKEVNIDGIRIAFHKKDLLPAMEMCQEIKEKGYDLFLQPMVSLTYSDEEFIDLIKRGNEISPYAFYIVDSFGVMKHRDLIRLFYLVEHNLSNNISIGFHSHNNMQLAYSNSQALLGCGSRHELIIDSSVFGMGRGAGNLNTELFVEYLNDNYRTNYGLKPLLNIVDEILNSFYQKNYWGYSLPNYLSAKYNTHPNYASFLDSKKTLTMDSMDEIFSMMDDNKRVSYDREYIEKLYVQYLASGEVQEANKSELRKQIKGKTVLIIAPGRSSLTEKEKIVSEMKKGIVSISVNFDYEEAETSYVFLSNLRRFREFPKKKIRKCIVTSNIPFENAYVKTNYKELLNTNKVVMDNAGLMLVQFIINLGCSKVLLAGLDGFEYDTAKNFADKRMSIEMSRERIDAENKGISEVLQEYNKMVPIEFLTEPRFIKI